MDKSLRYNPNKLLSYNRILNFVIGARGIGKSYGYKKHVVKRFIKHGEQFIYLRRFKTELTKIGQFFDDIAPEFEGHKLETKGRGLYVDGKQAGWAIPLSSWQSEKSTAYPNVCTILFDEFLREKDLSGYLPNEVESLLNIMDTVFRTRDNVRCICMSNAVTLNNIYFVYFKLFPKKNQRFYTTESIAVEIPDSADFSHERLKTSFGKLINNTNYGDMAMNNEFVLDTDIFIEPKSTNSKFSYLFKVNGKRYGVWHDKLTQTMYLSKKYDQSAKYQFTMKPDEMDEQTVLVKQYKQVYPVSKFVHMFKIGSLMFEDLETREAGYEILKQLRI